MARLRKTRRPPEPPPSLLEDLEAAEAENRRLKTALADAEQAARDYAKWAVGKFADYREEIARLQATIADLEREVMSPGRWTVA